MWVPLLKSEVSEGLVLSSRTSRSERTVFILVDPALLVVGQSSYDSIQAAAAKTCASLQRGSEPMLVGLQDEFWLDYEQRGPRSSSRPRVPVQTRQYGAVTALLEPSTKRLVQRLEAAGAQTESAACNQRAFNFLERSKSAYLKLVDAYEEAARSHCKVPLTQQLTTPHAPLRSPGELVALASSLSVPIPGIMRLFARYDELQRGLDLRRVELEQGWLLSELRGRSAPSTLLPRAALEIRLFEAQRRNLDQAASWGRMLEQLEPPTVPQQVISSASQLLNESFADYLGGAGVTHQPGAGPPTTVGGAEFATRLLDLAPILGVDAQKYHALTSFVYQARLRSELDRATHYSLAPRLFKVYEDLERKVVQALSLDADERTLVELAATFNLLRSLANGHLIYETRAQTALRSLRLKELRARLAPLTPVSAWPDDAWIVQHDAEVDVLLDATELSQRRAKLLTKALLSAIDEGGFRSALMICESHLANHAVSALPSSISYVLMWPQSTKPN